MTYDEAIAAFAARDNYPILVETRSGTKYHLEYDVVVNQKGYDDPYVYGFFAKRNPRRKSDHHWFYLSSVIPCEGVDNV